MEGEWASRASYCPKTEAADSLLPQRYSIFSSKDGSASLSQWYVDKAFLNRLTAGNPVVLEFYVDAALGVDLRMWAIPSSDEVSASADGLVEEALEFEGTTDADGRMVA